MYDINRKRNGKKIKPRKCYFEREIENSPKGISFLEDKSVEQFQQDCIRSLFPDMLRGNVPYNKYGQFFDVQHVDMMVQFANEEFAKYDTLARALDVYSKTYPMPQFMYGEINNYIKKASDYCILRDALIQCINNGCNLGYLEDISRIKVSADNRWKQTLKR